MIEVTCAIITKNNKTLATQRSEKMSLPLKWEFPGGKVEKNETAEASLVREIFEELNLDIKIIGKLQPNLHKYSEDKVIKLIPFICEIVKGEIKLLEHSKFLWLQKDELLKLEWAEADIPIVKEYISIL
jgi:8-oxo-dGTP diphosphatase